MQSDIPKPLIEVQGEPMLTHVLRMLEHSGVAEAPVLVVGAWTNAIQDHYGEAYQYAVQEEINGTGGAVQVALPYIDTTSCASPVMILYADHPFLRPASIRALAREVTENSAVLTMYTVTVSDFADWRQPFMSFGRIVRDDAGAITRIVEYKNATDTERGLTEVNPALYCVQAKWLASALDRITPNPLTGEYYLTDLVEIAVADGQAVHTISLSPQEALGLNSRADIENAKQAP